MATQQEIGQNYQNLFGRKGDAGGMDFWGKSGLSGDELKTEMVNVAKDRSGFEWDKGKQIWGKPVAGLTPSQAPNIPSNRSAEINKAYLDILGRPGENTGMAWWDKTGLTGDALVKAMQDVAIDRSGYARQPGTIRLAKPGTTLTTPGMVDNQAAMNKGIPGLFKDLTGMENYKQAYSDLQGLPGKIDEWTDESLKHQRMTGDMAQGVMNRVAGQRAGGGIMGGTEAENLQANEAARLDQIILENQNKIRQNANQLKAGTIQGLPGQALQPIQLGTNLYGTTANEAATWGNMALQSLLKGY